METQRLEQETKLETLNRLAKGESGATLAQFYNVGKSTISDGKKKPRNHFKICVKTTQKMARRRRLLTRFLR
ncbi:hypothetical protein TNCV_3303741 [Trichonephila clavipes]|nr:hypothetical protein TNCV_3303741 [Trichonephila clavipes]